MNIVFLFYVFVYKCLCKNVYKFVFLVYNKYASEKSTWDYPKKSLASNWQMAEGIYLFVKPVARNDIEVTTPFDGGSRNQEFKCSLQNKLLIINN